VDLLDAVKRDKRAETAETQGQKKEEASLGSAQKQHAVTVMNKFEGWAPDYRLQKAEPLKKK
jgi:hypothetical protein